MRNNGEECGQHRPLCLLATIAALEFGNVNKVSFKTVLSRAWEIAGANSEATHCQAHRLGDKTAILNRESLANLVQHHPLPVAVDLAAIAAPLRRRALWFITMFAGASSCSPSSTVSL